MYKLQLTLVLQQVPFVPVVPSVSILINIYLMLKLDADTWIRFGVWMVIGKYSFFYFGLSWHE
jgi:hypothetical protein